MSSKPSKLSGFFALALVVSAGPLLGGCASTTVDESTFFVDPSRYALYDCKTLAAYRVSYGKRAEELRGLMVKAESGVAGPIVAEMAYRPDYLTNQAQLKSLEAMWRQNRCDSANQASDPSFARPSPGTEPVAGRSKSSVY